ncbi:MAG TPA: helix-turn-helix transcriptional regulator [Gemmatimonadaceae bacterium]|nr:helix-turn-helix transcriptional regulator [Gemmatimonadaceae bacterium]
MPSLQISFGETLRELRVELGMSQEKLAQKAKVSRNFVGSVERGESSLSLDVADRMARTVGVSLSDFLKAVDAKRK